MSGMAEEFLASWAAASWAVIIVAYVFGLLTGWIIWSRQAAAYDAGADAKTPSDLASEQSNGDAHSAVAFASAKKSRFVAPEKEGASDERPKTQEEIAAALTGELKKAYEAMASIDVAQAGQNARLHEIDQALKRANGRLKRIHSAIEKNQ